MIDSIAIGSFDGMHTAHMELISRADAVVVIERNSATLTAGYLRAKYTSKPLHFYHFDKIKNLTPSEFVDKLNADFPELQKIVVGYDFAFGKNKSGNSDTIKKLFGGESEVVSEITINGIGVHSKVIRELLRDGKIDEANLFLGREYEISGEVVAGQGLGANKLVATINIEVTNHLLPKDGVYCTKTKIDDIWHSSITFIGHRVTTDGKFAIETHIIYSDIGVVDGEVDIKFVEFLRDNRKFESVDELKEQIILDIARCK